ncbi:hypothetical protein ACJZ2D_008796 [Fusarium nematophilum]
MITESTASIDHLLASLQSSDNSAESEAKRDAFANFVSEEFAKRKMATTQAAPLPSGVPSLNGVNGANGIAQTRPPSFGSAAARLPESGPASSTSAASPHASKAAPQTASPAQPSPYFPSGQQKSPPMSQGAFDHGALPPPPQHHSPQRQDAQNSFQVPSRSPNQPHEAPSSATVQHSPPVPGHTSPQANQAQSVEGSHGYQELFNLVNNTPAGAVRQVVRDKWEKALMGSQYHISFLLNATMHQASPETLSRAVQEFGGKLAQTSKRELMMHLNANDFDELTDMILARVSTQFLDKALARRLETIPARQLVNALARAERLGYDVQDIVQDQGGEHVIPSMHSLAIPPNLPPTAATPQQYHKPQPVPSQAPHSIAQPIQGAPSTAPFNTNPPSPLPQGPPGVRFCDCGWPCSSLKALEHHQRKRACGKTQDSDRPGRDICTHCGCRFGSGGGLLYHEKSNVCGAYTAETSAKMLALIAAFREQKRNVPVVTNPAPQPARAFENQIPGRSTPKASTQVNWVVSNQLPPSSTPGRDPYAHLTNEQRTKFEEEMKEAEERYGKLMREATLLSEPEKSRQLASLKNCYNTKQSTTRKRYGIRLRERRTKAEIAAERSRLLGSPSGSSTPARSTPARDSDARPIKRARANTEGQPTTTANASQEESPRKRVPVSEMGGLSGSSATAELTDPTTYLSPSQPRYVPQKPASTSNQQSEMATTADHIRRATLP